MREKGYTLFVITRSKLHQYLTRFDSLFLFLACLMIPMMILEYAIAIPVVYKDIFHGYFLFLWALFLLEFVIKLSLSSSKKIYLKTNWVDVVIIFFPFLRILRIIEISEIGFLILIERFSNFLSSFHLQSFFKTLILTIVIVAVSSELILFLEKPYAQSHIKNFGDAIWWSTVGISTIGVGNVVPVSSGGKVLTIFLMVSGIVLFSMLTANITALFTERDVRKDMSNELKTIEKDFYVTDRSIEKEIADKDTMIEQKLEIISRKLSDLEEKKS